MMRLLFLLRIDPVTKDLAAKIQAIKNDPEVESFEPVPNDPWWNYQMVHVNIFVNETLNFVEQLRLRKELLIKFADIGFKDCYAQVFPLIT